MTEFNVGDRVKLINIDFNDVWNGCEATVTEVLKGRSYKNSQLYSVFVDGPNPYRSYNPEYATWNGDGKVDENQMELISSDNDYLADLRKAVDRLRKLGYTVETTVTEPVSAPVTHNI